MDKQQPKTEVEAAGAASSKAAAADPCILQGIEDAERNPAFFTCTSGELLWGQVHTVIEGAAATELDTELGPQDDTFRYKVAARKGRWKVAAAFQDNFEGKPWHIGYVCHHTDTDGVEILRRASEAGIWNTGKFADLDIVCVNRSDWSGEHNFDSNIVARTVEGKGLDYPEEESEDYEQDYGSLAHSRFLLLDADGFPNLIQTLKNGTSLERKNYLMRYKDGATATSEDPAFGIHLVVQNTEYELAWMAFRNGEAVGFVYDGAYSALEGDNLRLGDNPGLGTKYHPDSGKRRAVPGGNFAQGCPRAGGEKKAPPAPYASPAAYGLRSEGSLLTAESKRFGGSVWHRR